MQVPGETVVVEKEVVKTVEVPGQTVVVEKVVTQTVEVPGETVVVEKEVVKTVEVPGETVVVEKVVVKEVPAGYVTDPTNGKVVSAPQYGGTLTQATKGNWKVFDTYLAGPPIHVGGIVVEKLGMLDWGLDRDEFHFRGGYVLPLHVIRGALAESWEQPDPLTYVFNIRKGVQWHNKAPMNGRELTAEDIEYNFHRMVGLGSGFTEVGALATAGQLGTVPIESITATDEYTVVFKLKEPYLRAPILIQDSYNVFT